MEGRPQDRCPLCSEALQAAAQARMTAEQVRMTAEPVHMTAVVRDSGNRPAAGMLPAAALRIRFRLGRPASFREAEACQPESL